MSQPSTVSRRSVLVGAAAASAAIGTSLPAGTRISPRLAKMLEQRERLDAEIAKLLGPHKALLPRVPDAIRIDPKEATPQFLQSSCATFYRAPVDGENCLWGAGGWWEDRDDAERTEIARRYALGDCAEHSRLTDPIWEHVEGIRDELGELEYEISKTEAATPAELRVLAHVVNEQFLSGRTIGGAIPYSFVANVLRIIG